MPSPNTKSPAHEYEDLQKKLEDWRQANPKTGDKGKPDWIQRMEERATELKKQLKR